MRCQEQINLAQALEDGTNEPVSFGMLRLATLAKLNAIRLQNGVQQIKEPDIYIYRSVIEKLRRKRLKTGHMKSQSLARIAFSALFNRRCIVLPSRFPHIQVCATIRADGQTANAVYIGEYKGCCSIKSIYINDLKDILKQAGKQL